MNEGGMPLIQFIIMFCLGSFACLLSVIGSYGIMLMARTRQKQMLQRLLIRLAVCDIGLSIVVLLNPILSYSLPDSHVALGNETTCTIMGFTKMVLNTMVTSLNALISVFFLMRIRFNVTERKLVKYFERPLCVLSLVVTIGFAIAALVSKSYNPQPDLLICTMYEFPAGCRTDENVTCRSEPTTIPILYMHTLLLTSLGLIGIASVLYVYIFVRRRTLRQLPRTLSSQSNTVERVRSVARQALLYALVYTNGSFWTLLWVALLKAPGVHWSVHFALNCASWFFYPSQGFFNFLVYTWPAVQEWKKRDPTAWTFSVYTAILRGKTGPDTSVASNVGNTQKPLDNRSPNPSRTQPAAKFEQELLTFSQIYEESGLLERQDDAPVRRSHAPVFHRNDTPTYTSLEPLASETSNSLKAIPNNPIDQIEPISFGESLQAGSRSNRIGRSDSPVPANQLDTSDPSPHSQRRRHAITLQPSTIDEDDLTERTPSSENWRV